MDTNQQMGAINNNIISARSFTQPLSNFVSEEAICKGVRYHYQTNSEGEVIKDKIIAVSYWLVCPNTFTNYTLRVNSSQPVVTPEELETTTTFIELYSNRRVYREALQNRVWQSICKYYSTLCKT